MTTRCIFSVIKFFSVLAITLILTTFLLPAAQATASGAVRTSSKSSNPPRTKAICVVHCDPVRESDFEKNWAMLEDLVATADASQAKLSLHFTGSYASLALKTGKAEEVKRWLANGHGAGTHPHPEYAEGDNWQPQVAWTAFPQERAVEAMTDATEAVNRLVGAENNVVLDTLFPFYATPAVFPAQFTHFAWGNNGHGEPVPIVLPNGRTITAVFYRTLPGEPKDPFHLTAEQMADEFRSSGGVAYGPVLHPVNFRDDGKRELTAWFRWVEEQGVTPVRVRNLSAETSKRSDEALRVWCEVAQSEGPRKTATIRVQNQGKADLKGLNLTTYLPIDYSGVTLDEVVLRPSQHDTARNRFIWTNQTVPAGTTATYTLPLGRIARPVNHPISGVLDVYLDGTDISPRWSFVTLAGGPDSGWYLPFESYNPTGRATSAVTRTASKPAEPPQDRPSQLKADRATGDRIRNEVQTQPTNEKNAAERLNLLFSCAQAFLDSGRQADLDTVLPPERFESLQQKVQSGDASKAAAEINQLLLKLADMLSQSGEKRPNQ